MAKVYTRSQGHLKRETSKTMLEGPMVKKKESRWYATE